MLWSRAMLPRGEGCSTQISSWGGEGTSRTCTKRLSALCGAVLFEPGCALGRALEDAHRPPRLSRRAPGTGGRRRRGLVLLEDENVSVPSLARSFHPSDELSSASALS